MHWRIIIPLCYVYATITVLNTSSFSLQHQDEIIREIDHHLKQTGTTKSGVILEWVFKGSLDFEMYSLRYHFFHSVRTRETLEWDPWSNYFKATASRQVFESGRFEHLKMREKLYPADGVMNRATLYIRNSPFINLREVNISHLLISVNDLNFPDTNYVFELVQRSRVNDSTPTTRGSLRRSFTEVTIAQTVGRSKAVKPIPLKICVGCFQVRGLNSTHRSVNVYWRREEKYEYVVSVYRRMETNPIETDVNFLGMVNYHATFIDLTYHSFIFVSANTEGHSAPSFVRVPAQIDIVPRLSNFSFSKEINSTVYTLSWKEQENVTVLGYTVAWVSASDDTLLEVVYDFVYLNASSNSFQVDIDEPEFQLAVSVNTKYSSSGLHLVATVRNNSVHQIHRDDISNWP